VKARVQVMLKNGVLDPQGKAIEHSLASLGFSGVDEVRMGKVIEVDVAETDVDKARAQVTEMCEKLLANTVIERYEIQLEDGSR
jgi:phosphoribosylformylglycinamidine synthase subunit PurS